MARGLHPVTSEMVETEPSRQAYVWPAAEGTPAIVIGRPVMDEIRAHVLAGYRSVSGRGLEVGGALIGHFETDPATGGRRVTIEGYEPVDISHQNGPSYIFSEEDAQRWRDWIAALRHATPSLVGICRSHTRPGLRVAPEDAQLIRAFVGGGDGALLLVKPLSDRECVAAFFPFIRGIVIDGNTTSREFPFGDSSLPEPAHAAISVARSRTKPISKWVMISAVAAGVTAALIMHYLPAFRDEVPVSQSRPPVAAPTLGLRGERMGDSIRVSWNRAAVTPAVEATLIVTERNTRTASRLTPADRQRGYIDWRPKAQVTGFELTIAKPGGTPAVESLRVVNPTYPINSYSHKSQTKPAGEGRASAPAESGEDPPDDASRPPGSAGAQLAPKSHQGDDSGAW
ncbi:MAG TPA: hypothetical protein VKB79_18190 [Bryobacteraceae bacterium]|nr:hypothetical protein [Bryobacteraceae bacterium]